MKELTKIWEKNALFRALDRDGSHLEIYQVSDGNRIRKVTLDGLEVWSAVLEFSSYDRVFFDRDGRATILGRGLVDSVNSATKRTLERFAARFEADGRLIEIKEVSLGSDIAFGDKSGSDGSIYRLIDSRRLGKYDLDGLLLWTYELKNNDELSISAFEIGADNTVHITGRKRPPFGLDHGNYDFFLIRLGINGQETFNKSYGSPGWEEPYNVEIMQDGSSIVVGETDWHFSNGKNMGGWDAFLSHIDTAGNIKASLIGSSAWEQARFCRIQGRVTLVLGNTDGDLDRNKNSGLSDMFITAYLQGKKLWTALLGTSDWDEAMGILASDPSSIVIAGLWNGQQKMEKYKINSQPSDITIIGPYFRGVNIISPSSLSYQGLVGYFKAVDSDLFDSGLHTYSLVAGEGATDNPQFILDQSSTYGGSPSLRLISPSKENLQRSYSIRIRTEDIFGLATEKTFVLFTVNSFGSSMSDELLGSSADAIIAGLGGDDKYLISNSSATIIEDQLGGDDTVIADVSFQLPENVENLALTGTNAINGTGNGLNNRLTGNSANNVLNGGAGADVMAGGKGNDTYIVDNDKDVVSEAVDSGTDTVQASVSHTLRANVENLILIGTSAINGTGNRLNNVLTGNSAANVLTGGLGNDIYVIGAGDTVVEAASAGTDTVQSSITHALAANVENLTLTGSGVINGTGNSLNNVLTGNSAKNTLTGGNGSDTLRGEGGIDTLIGISLSDTNRGRGTVDVLTGGAGADLFMLGNKSGIFYSDSDTAKAGRSDYARITDFSNGDKIQLKGKASDYVLKSGDTVSTFKGIGLYRNDGIGTGASKNGWDKYDEFIGLIQTGSGLTLNLTNTSQFTYVA